MMAEKRQRSMAEVKGEAVRVRVCKRDGCGQEIG